MEENIGDMLVTAGNITPAQLDEALKCQVIFGGRIGTNLIELGYLTEDELSRALSRKLGVPAADPDRLMNLPADIVAILPRELVEKFKVVPYSLDKKRLNLVMVDPINLAVIDEISFRTGFIVLPMVAPEVRILCALEKYYDIKREMRYINVSHSIRQDKEAKDAARGGAPAEQKMQPPAAGKSPEEAASDLDFSSIFEGFHTLPGDQDVESFSTTPVPGAAVQPPPSAQPSAAKAPVVPQPASAVAPSPVSKPATSATVAPAVPPPAPAAPVVTAGPYTLDDLAGDLAGSTDREGIADVIMKYIGQHFTRCALFRVRGNTAAGWRAVVKKRMLDDFEELQITFSEPSTLKLVAEGKSFYLGPLPENVNNRLMLAALGSSTLPTALLVPLLMMGKVVAVLYVDGEQAALGEKLPELQKIIAKAALAFEILILRTKILVH